MVKEFEFFLKKGNVKKQSPDRNLSLSTFNESLDRINMAKNILKKEKSKYVLENAYEAMKEAADAILYFDGFKSFSHEASIIYLLKKGFSEKEINEFDRFRKIRNDIKYYGKDCNEDDAVKALELSEKIINKVRRLFGKYHR